MEDIFTDANQIYFFKKVITTPTWPHRLVVNLMFQNYVSDSYRHKLSMEWDKHKYPLKTLLLNKTKEVSFLDRMIMVSNPGGQVECVIIIGC